MTFEAPRPKENNQERREIRKGIALKAFIAVTNGVLERNARKNEGKGVLVSVVDKTIETYGSLERLERKIDPSGRLSGEIEEKITSGLRVIGGRLKKLSQELKEL